MAFIFLVKSMLINLVLIFHLGLMQFNQVQKVMVPYNHQLTNSRKIDIQVEFINGFEADRETVFLLEDAFDKLFMPFDQLLDFSESSNFVLIKGRKESEELKRGIMHNDKPDYSLAYRLFNQDQVARDIEIVRKTLIGNKKVILVGYSSSAMVFQHYLSLFPDKVSRMISVNPLVFDIQKNLSFPRNEPFLYNFNLQPKQIFDFNYYANYERYNLTESESKTLSFNSLIQVLRYRNLLSGFSNNDKIENDIPLLIRLFEHSFAYSGLQEESQNDPNFLLLKALSSPIWDVYKEDDFPVYGTNYDQVLNFQGKLVLIAGAYDQLIFPKSYDALAELYRNSTLMLLRDGHALQKTAGRKMLIELVDSFIQDDFESKIKMYENLSESNLIFKKYDEGEFRVPPLF